MADASTRPTISRRHLTAGAAAFIAAPALGRTHTQGTPGVGGDSGPERLASLLSLVPASLADHQGFVWSDIAAQAASIGVAMPTGLPQAISADVAAALAVLPLSFIAPNPPVDPAVHERFGFSAVTAHQELNASGGIFGPTLLRGGLPLETLPAFWAAAGYARETTPEGIDIWTVPDLPNEGASGPNVAPPPDWLFAILDETLVVGRDVAPPDSTIDIGAQVAAIITQATTGGASLLDTGAYRDLIATLAPDTVSVIARPGTALDIAHFAILPPGQSNQGTPRDLVENDPNQVPPVLDLVYAITGGGRGQGVPFSNASGTPGVSPVPPTAPDPGDAIVQTRLRFATADEASQAITTIETRWNAWDSVTLEVPYADLLAIESAQPSPTDPTIAAIDFRPIGTPTNWLYLFLNGDVLPFAYVSLSPDATPSV